MERIRVLIADDHPIFRRGLREVLGDDGRFDVVAECKDGLEALESLRAGPVDIALLDFSMPRLDGLEVAVQVAGWPERPRVVLLTMYDSYLDKALEAGVLGYLLKEDAEAELIECLDAVGRGEHYISAGLEGRRPTADDGGDPVDVLSTSERRVVKLVGEFKTSRQIAEILKVSVRTVQNHRASAVAKLGLSGANALLVFAVRNHETLTRK